MTSDTPAPPTGPPHATNPSATELSAPELSTTVSPLPEDHDQLLRAVTLVAVANHGSFSAAARALGLSRSAVSERIQRLEESLEVRLLERTTRRVRLTDEGALVLAGMERALGAWSDVRDALDAQRAEPRGVLRVTCPGGLAGTLVAPVVAQLLAQYPSLRAELLVDDKTRDLVAEGIDVAIRMAALSDSSHRVRRLANVQTIVVAAPALAAAHAPTAAGLAAAPWVEHAFARDAELELRSDATDETTRFRPIVRCGASSSEAERALVAGGAGLSLIPEVLVAADLESGRLVRVGDWRGRSIPLSAVFPSGAFVSPRTRALLDALVEASARFGGG